LTILRVTAIIDDTFTGCFDEDGFDMKDDGVKREDWISYHHGWETSGGEIIAERSITIFVNGVEFVTVMGTPLNQDWLAVGFLINERVIDGPEEIEELRVMSSGCCVDVWVNKAIKKPEKTIITSGCGGGITYNDPSIGVEPFEDQIRLSPEILQEAFNGLQTKDSLYVRSRGVHSAGLLDIEKGELVFTVEDVGRHNTIDKLRGGCLALGIPTRGNALISTGRISSEMLRKSALMGCPLVASRTSPTSLSVEIARAWNLTLAGYVRHGKMRVYSAPERLGFEG
jgi:FdhD protein